MRANHASKPQEPDPHGVTGARRGIARRLPRPRAVAAGGALLAQLWSFGSTGAHAAAADPLREPAQPAVRRALHDVPALGAPALGGPALDGPALDGPGLDGQSAERPAGQRQGQGQDQEQGQDQGQGQERAQGPARGRTPAGEPTGGVPVDGTPGALDHVLRERIRAGGLPLPGQRAAVPDAFAIASGLFDADPAQARPAETRASREGVPAGLDTAGRPRSGSAGPAVPRQREATEATQVLEAAPVPAPASAADRPDGADAATPAAPDRDGTPETLAIDDTATVTAVDDGSATATAVLAPIAAGLLLTGAAMCKHRGLPRGH
ncbi:hypothetical protein ACFQ6N_30660 [Kitasatospora sp. NPDC056446]|uniref:hypothetical protein n=1 Tax=Kitasatospora sp. NPDC056446 TaxID=3345819 RepID=UPI0036AB835C